jgi:hypothetical protein
VDRVDGECRFVGAASAATTAEPPVSDLVTGIRHALELLQARSDRRVLAEDGQLIAPERASGQGVDAFCAVTSAATPLRVAIVGLCRAVSVASSARAIQSTYATIVATLALDEIGGRWMQLPAPDAGDDGKIPPPPKIDPQVAAAETLARANPEVIVLVGGIDGGATSALYELANLVAAIAAANDESTRPVILFAGNRDARAQIAARIGQNALLRVADNVHPALDVENIAPLQRELEALYEERKIARLPGLGALGNWTTAKIIPAASAFERTVRYLSRRYALNVLGVDVGGSATTIVQADADAYTRIVRADLGTGRALERMLARAGAESFLRWLPMDISVDEALAHWFHHSAYPHALPTTRDELFLLQAAARHAVGVAAREGQVDPHTLDLLLLSGGAFAQNANLAALALLALDALEPSGVFTLAVDAFGLASAYGALAGLDSAAAAGVIERDAFTTLGTVIAPLASHRGRAVDLRIRVQSASGAVNVEVEHGSLELIPLPPGQKASLEVRASAGVSLGAGRGGVFKAEIEGGALGLIVDARGRPIQLPDSPEKRRVQVQEWLWDMGA